MKALKILGIILGLLALILVGLSMIAPKELKVERSVSIKAPTVPVFSYLKNLKKRSLWSPWEVKDPNIKVTLEGTDGMAGAISSWESEIVGVGSQELIGVKENERVDTKLRFVEPYSSEADSYMILEPDGDANKVIWGFTSELGFPFNVIMMLTNGAGSIGKDFDSGLSKLKELVEAEMENAYGGYAINKIDMPELHYVGVKEKIDFDEVASFYAKNFPKAFAAVQAKKVAMNGMPSGVIYSFDDTTKEIDLMAAIPVKTAVDLGKNFVSIKLPAGKALKTDYYGAYKGSDAAHISLNQYLADSGLVQKYPIIEEYVTDPSVEADTSKWLTKITYPLK